MANQPYLAMTAAEFLACNELPPKVAWMACHFSPYGRGLSNVPRELPPGSMLILNDRIEPLGIDPDLVVRQLLDAAEALDYSAVLLDFQRPANALTRAVAEALCKVLPCPLAVSAAYARDLSCAVFLSPPGLREDAAAYFAPWTDREIWLEYYPQQETVYLTELGSEIAESVSKEAEFPHFDEKMCCHYGMQIHPGRAIFTLCRDLEDYRHFPCRSTHVVALWQDYGS